MPKVLEDCWREATTSRSSFQLERWVERRAAGPSLPLAERKQPASEQMDQDASAYINADARPSKEDSPSLQEAKGEEVVCVVLRRPGLSICYAGPWLEDTLHRGSLRDDILKRPPSRRAWNARGETANLATRRKSAHTLTMGVGAVCSIWRATSGSGWRIGAVNTPPSAR